MVEHRLTHERSSDSEPLLEAPCLGSELPLAKTAVLGELMAYGWLGLTSVLELYLQNWSRPSKSQRPDAWYAPCIRQDYLKCPSTPEEERGRQSVQRILLVQGQLTYTSTRAVQSTSFGPIASYSIFVILISSYSIFVILGMRRQTQIGQRSFIYHRQRSHHPRIRVSP